MTRPSYENFSNHRDSNSCVNDLPKPTIWERIRGVLKLLTLFVLSIVVFIFAALVSAIGSSLLGIIYASKETIEHLKGLFQKEKRASSLWRLFSITASAYVGWILGAIIGVAIFSSGAGLVIGGCIVLGWAVGIVALTVKYIPLLNDYFFPKKDDNRDASSLGTERTDSPGVYEDGFLLSHQSTSVSYSRSSESSKPAIPNSSKGFFWKFFAKEAIQRNQDAQLLDCSSSAPSELISYMKEQSKFER